MTKGKWWSIAWEPSCWSKQELSYRNNEKGI